MPNSDRIVACARRWRATPYRHQASVKNVGCDCLGLVRGVFREIYGSEPERVPAYPMDWSIASNTLVDAARRHLAEIKTSERAPGDVLLFGFGARPARHAAIMSDNAPPMIIHAYAGHAVREEPLERWRKHLRHTFRFPEIS